MREKGRTHRFALTYMGQLIIYHTNDLHNRREIFSLLSRVPKDENTILLDSGDALGGSNTLFYPREPIISLMNEVGYTAMAMGNREFHYLRGVLRRRYESARFPILSANVKDLTGKSSHCWKEYMLVKRAGITVGITGLSPVQFPEKSFLTKVTGFLFIPPGIAIESVVSRFKEEKADIVIVLSHLGVKEDRLLAEMSGGIDLIIGGHSHTLLEKPLTVNGTYIVQSGCLGRYLGKMGITYENGSISDMHYELIPVSEK